MVKTAVLVSGGGLNLQSLLDAKLFGELPKCDLTAVISSNPDAYALIRAEAAQIPTYVIDRDLFPNETVFSQAVSDKLKDLDIELVVLAGYDYALPPSVFKRFAGKIIDTCAQLIPPSTNGEAFGATAYFVMENPDIKPVITSQPVSAEGCGGEDTIERRLLQNGENVVLPRAVSLFCTGCLRFEDGAVIHISEYDNHESRES